MDIRSAVLESRKRDEETKNIRNKGFKGIARELWVSDSIPGPRLIVIPGKRGSCELVPYGIKKDYSGWKPTFDDLVADDWFVTVLTRKVELEGGD